MNFILLFFTTSLITACSGGSGGSKLIDRIFGGSGITPILTSVQDRTIAQGDQLLLDVNNIMSGSPGTDEDMNYTCFYDREADGEVKDTLSCADLPNSTISFDARKGELLWTPGSGVLGNYEFRITGKSKDGSYDEVFVIGVRLKFNGISQYTSISGTTVTMTWTPNPQATAYQILKLNSANGQYELFKTVADPNANGTTLTGLSPNTGYTFRAHALDILGFLDNNITSRSVTTTELVRLSMSAPSGPAPAGIAVPITVQAFNADGSPQTIGGLPVSLVVTSGTSVGSFSAVTDNNNGT
ncbi:MAG: fibronectin type III domain-containing protein, partial [Bdellovibrio sp.]|nr:fibronectin type III domain-containing protein [Bdellovibrio sp.]